MPTMVKKTKGTWVIWSRHKKGSKYAEKNELLATTIGAAFEYSRREMFHLHNYFDVDFLEKRQSKY